MANLRDWTYKLLQLSGTEKPAFETKPTTLQVFLNQLLDSAIVGGIAGISAYIAAGPDTTLKVLGISFALTFLVKLKGYRRVSD